MNQKERDEQEAKILTEQADKLVAQVAADVSDAETYTKGSEAFRLVANAYERIALAEKRTDAAAWFRTPNVDGRTAKEIMDRLWALRERLKP